MNVYVQISGGVLSVSDIYLHLFIQEVMKQFPNF